MKAAPLTEASPVVWVMEMVAPAKSAYALEEVLARHAEAVSAFEEDSGTVRKISAYTDIKPNIAIIESELERVAIRLGVAPPSVRVVRLMGTDWVAENRKAFPPISVGRFLILGTHHAVPKRTGRIVLRLDAGRAFGSGTHETTRGCLMALDSLARGRRFRRPLDLGCGSGILALAMAKQFQRPVLAADIDPVAVATVRENAVRNGVGKMVKAAVSKGFANRALRIGPPFDLIAANILARPLQLLAPDLAGRLAPGGTAILSGILRAQDRRVFSAYRAQGLVLRRRIVLGEWSTLMLGRAEEGRKQKTAPSGAVLLSPSRRLRPAAERKSVRRLSERDLRWRRSGRPHPARSSEYRPW